MKRILSILMLLSCISLSARERIFEISKGKDVSRMTVTESRENGFFTYTFDYGDSRTTKTVDSQYRSISWVLVEPSKGTNITVALKGDGYHFDGTYNGKEVHKVIERSGNNAWMQGIGYCGGYFLKAGGTYDYESINLHNLKTYDMRAVYVGEEMMDGKKVHHFSMSPKGALSKLWKSHYYYDVATGDLVGQRSPEGLPGSADVVWKVL